MGVGGFFKSLGKGLLKAAPFIAAPFTGGASLAAAPATGALSKILGTVGKIAPVAGAVAGGLASGAQKGREDENTAAQDAALFKLKESGQHEQNLMGREDLALAQKKYSSDQLQKYYALAKNAALTKNMQDVKLTGLDPAIPKVTFSGGSRPSALGQEGRDAAALMFDKAMGGMKDGETFNTLPALERVQAAEFKKPGVWENILGATGVGLNAVNAANTQKQQQSFQDKITAAIEALSNKGGSTTPVASSPATPPPSASGTGVLPTLKPVLTSPTLKPQYD